ncbi:putative disease resistance RPP13-like protein 1 [Salvia hispanica]|uniref:putative disease resistance RPP13-like protein 1 n=1 Tax=Salvia hispanica TaxID=49212 RepID=UPI0020097E59|nr:putative disease resistance RPP13-like protein 1 [Salvia hispanica]
MTDAIISQVAERVAAIIQDQIHYKVSYVIGRGGEKELLDLFNKLNTIRNVLDDAEMKGVNNQSVKNWLKKLQGTAYEIDYFLDEWIYSLLRLKMEAERKVGGSFSLSSALLRTSVRHNITKKIEKVKAKLAQILEEMNEFKFVRKLNGGLANSQPATDHPMLISWQEQSTSSIDFKIDEGSAIYKEKNDIMRKLMCSGGNIQIMSIVGTSGLGKTTLAQLIFNDPEFEKDWLKIWVCVPDPFVVDVVAKNIVEYVGKERIPPNTNQSESDLVLKKLKASVEKRKFLLVLDDASIEDRDKWEFLYMYLQYGAPGSKILVTTRNEKTAKMMDSLDDDICRPSPLSFEKFWSLLRDISLPGKNAEECGEFKGVGKKIARKCKGLPLAAIVLGRLLRFKDLEGWKDVEKSEIWEMENEEVKPFPYLALSYNELSPDLKLCFSYCAIYPKNYRFHVETLIEEWVAQGYMGTVSGNSGVELGRKCFKKLATRSLFQDFEKSGEEIKWCKMHDVVRDFALICRMNTEISNRRCPDCDARLVSQAQDYRCLFWNKESPLDHCDCVTSVKVLRIENRPPPAGMEDLIHLRWLDFKWTTVSKHDLKIICKLYLLQTLSLSRCNLTEIPREIGNLIHLRRLDLSCNEKLKELPESMYSLVELRTLSLSCCSLKEIREEIGNLTELTGLDLSWNRGLKKLPGRMYSLAKLQTLSLACCSVQEISSGIMNLDQLRNLDLSGNASLKLPESISCLVELRTLSLACCSLEKIRTEIWRLRRLTQLNLSWNRELEYLPESINRLVELQILNIEGTEVHHRLPQAVGKLSNLALVLREFKVGSQYNKLGLLKKVKHSTGSLTLDISFSTMSKMVKLVEDAREVQLKILFQELEKLKISFEGTMNENEPSSSSLPSRSSMWMKLLEALEPHHKLKQLTIWRYEGSTLPSWMSSPNSFIKEMSLHYLSEVSSLPALGKLPFLEVLCIDNLKKLKQVGREFLGIESASNDDVVAFPKLKELTFVMCPEWEEWEDITEEEEISAASIMMPCLTVLSINSCKSLKELPHRLLHKAASAFKLLDTEGSTELSKTYRSNAEDGYSFSFMAFFPLGFFAVKVLTRSGLE